MSETSGKMSVQERLTAPRRRNRSLYALLGIGVILLGLVSRRFGELLPGLLHKNTGDVLWALFVFLLGGLLWARRSTLAVAVAALLFSLCIEFGKFYHAPWLDTLRDTTPGRLIFGYVFSWSNLVCYLIGILIGVTLEVVTPHRVLAES